MMQTKREAVGLASLQPPVARRFVWRQLQLLQANHPGRTQFSAQQQEHAFEVVEEEMARDLNSLRR